MVSVVFLETLHPFIRSWAPVKNVLGGGSLLQAQSYFSKSARLMALLELKVEICPNDNNDDYIPLGDICAGICILSGSSSLSTFTWNVCDMLHVFVVTISFSVSSICYSWLHHGPAHKSVVVRFADYLDDVHIPHLLLLFRNGKSIAYFSTLFSLSIRTGVIVHSIVQDNHGAYILWLEIFQK